MRIGQKKAGGAAAMKNGQHKKRGRCRNENWAKKSRPLPPGTVQTLPQSLLDALQQLEQNTVLPASMGQDFTVSYLKLQHQAWAEHVAQMTD